MTISDWNQKKETERQLLRFAAELKQRDWGDPERNTFASQLANKITLAVHQGDSRPLEELQRDVVWFRSPVFTLGERINILMRGQKDRVWKTDRDNRLWQGLVVRAEIAYRKRDQSELKELGRKISGFLRRNNEHKLAQPLDDAR